VSSLQRLLPFGFQRDVFQTSFFEQEIKPLEKLADQLKHKLLFMYEPSLHTHACRVCKLAPVQLCPQTFDSSTTHAHKYVNARESLGDKVHTYSRLEALDQQCLVRPPCAPLPPHQLPDSAQPAEYARVCMYVYVCRFECCEYMKVGPTHALCAPAFISVSYNDTAVNAPTHTCYMLVARLCTT
jgi:hypothetical protein